MKKSWIILPFIIITIFSFSLLERVNTKFPLEIFKLIIYAISYSLPLLVTLILGEKYLDKNPDSKRIFWKMPIYSIIPTIIFVFLWISFPVIFGTASNEYGMVLLLIPQIILTFTLIYSSISLFLSIILYFKNKIFLIILSALIIILFLTSLVISVYYLSSCGINGCMDIDYLSKIAIEKKEPLICERALSDDKGLRSPILVTTEYRDGSVSECYLKLAKITNDSTMCEKVGLMWRDLCFVYFANNNFPIPCENMKKSNSKSVCYFEYAITLKNKNYCDSIQNITKDESMAVYMIETERFTQKRCQQIIDPKLKEVEDWLNKILALPTAEIDCDLNEEQAKNQCIRAFAFNNGDPRLCKSLPEELRQECCNHVFAKLFDKGTTIGHTWIPDTLVLTSEQEVLCGL